MNETQALARAQTLAWLFVEGLLVNKPETIKELIKREN